MNPWKALVTITAGKSYRFSTESLSVARAAVGDVLNFVGGMSDVLLPSIGEDDGRAEITLPTSLLDPQSLRASGVKVPGAPAEVALWREGTDYSKRVILLVGRVHPNGERRFANKVTLSLDSFEQQIDKQFPPWLITNEGFADVPAGSTGKTMPVVYGICNDVPLPPLRQPTPDLPTVDFLVSGSPLGTRTCTIRPDGRSGDSFTATIARRAHPGSGAVYNYVPLNAGGGGTNYIADGVIGHLGADGGVISGLGDVVDHAIRVYSGVTPDRIDEVRLGRFRAYANRITVASIFGGTAGQTVFQSLKGRYENNFPVSISMRGGRIGADYLDFDQADVPLRTLRLGAELLDRIDPVEIDGEMPYTDFTVEYDRNVVAGRFRSSLSIGPAENADCARAATRFGRVTYQTIQIPDLNDGQGARAVLNSLANRFAVQRTKVTYLLALDTMIYSPMLSAFLVTDAKMRWTAVKFRLAHLVPRMDGLCECTFLSYGDAV